MLLDENPARTATCLLKES